ncbi:MAG: hypothetical protein IPM15_03120 [Betaproteobacteria bacterium]|nr:hypothetical protein [Betaproteobacteria bacterium]MCC6249956.1 hypothetical protein [Rubrivivax sp.]MCL4697403.1 hypothetical protein [Burkholderiaceae bacterium]
MRRRARWLIVLLLLAVLVVAGTAFLALSLLRYSPSEAMQALEERSPVEMIGHAYRRLEGHPRLERVLHPPLNGLLGHLVREPVGPLRDLGKGVRPQGLRVGAPTRVLATAADIAAAMAAAQPGDVLEIAPGRYALPGTLYTRRGGRPDAPITLRAARPGTVTLEVRSVQGMLVAHPHWIIENLAWRGLCRADDECEHALHIVGDARGTVVRNNHFEDFSAHLKINGEAGRFPDDGLLQFSTLANTRPRAGRVPVALVDLVGASGWQLLDNRIEGFVKNGGDGVSYGMFMKGGGRGGRIERNVVVCTPRAVRQPGLRLGISIGGGGTGAEFCRDKRCDFEHDAAVVANNVVAHCNDAGIDVSKSRAALVAHNTLVNTQGILVRNPPADARVVNNVLDGRVRHRAGTVLAADSDNRRTGNLGSWLADADGLDLRWREAPELVATPAEVTHDFCGRRRAPQSEPGAGAAAACGR